MTFTSQLGEYFGRGQIEQSDAGLHEMKRLLLDYLGVALSGCRTDTGQIVADFVSSLGGAEQSTVLGRSAKVPAPGAAFANAVSSHSIELDDVDDEALFHYSPPVMSAVLAVAQSVGASGTDTISAALAGCEVMVRVSNATNPSLRDRGFHTTPTCGVFGAAVGAGRLLRLSGDQMTSALGLAGAQASGLMEMYGTSMQKRINPGPAARNGVTAAMLASRGFTGADTILEGERGFGSAFADSFDPEVLVEGLGVDVPVKVEYKPYSAARPIHNAIDCALEIRHTSGIRLADIESVAVYRHPMWSSYHVINAPHTFHEAQVSLPYSVAVAFADGSALPGQYSDERIATDRGVCSLAAGVRVVEDPSLARGVSCRMVVTTKDGRTLESTVDHPKGSIQNPLADADLGAKFRMLAGPQVPAERLDRISDMVFDVESVSDINDLVVLTHSSDPSHQP